jgi:hypothetical protein
LFFLGAFFAKGIVKQSPWQKTGLSAASPRPAPSGRTAGFPLQSLARPTGFLRAAWAGQWFALIRLCFSAWSVVEFPQGILATLFHFGRIFVS